jgi:hypothetical protein
MITVGKPNKELRESPSPKPAGVASTSTLDNFIDEDAVGQTASEIALLMKSVPMVDTFSDVNHELQ